MPMRTLLLSCLLSMGPLATLAAAHRPTQCQRTHERIERLRDLSSLGSPPTTLGSAKLLHAALQARVRQIEAKAVRKLQHPVRARRLGGFFDNAAGEMA